MFSQINVKTKSPIQSKHIENTGRRNRSFPKEHV